MMVSGHASKVTDDRSNVKIVEPHARRADRRGQRAALW